METEHGITLYKGRKKINGLEISEYTRGTSSCMVRTRPLSERAWATELIYVHLQVYRV